MPDETPTARSEVFALGERYVTENAARNPIAATVLGIHDFDHLLPTFTEERWASDAAHATSAIASLRALQPIDDVDRIAKSVMLERLEVVAQLASTGEMARTFSVLESPLSDIRQCFELMDTDAPESRARMLERLRQVRPALDSWRDGVASVARAGQLPPRRHVMGVAGQASTYGEGAYRSLVRSWPSDADTALDVAADADAACAELGTWLADVMADQATDVEACGEERYAVWSREYNGAALDFAELYEWGWQDLRRINARMWELAAVLAPDARRLVDVAALLDADDSRAIFGTDALLEKLEAFTAASVARLNGVHFDIDPRIQRCDAKLAPEGSAAAPYYIEPSEDLSRPGTTWFPTLGATRFPWWTLASTWYHEAVPGHHLQHASSMLALDRLSRFQRASAWTSGYGEGWALYAERLMDELGGFEDPAEELGFLQGQALRAARIVVDVGQHLGFDAPSDLGELADLGDCSSRAWTPAMAVALLEEWALMRHDFATSEEDRYLGLPAQAISYKVGERVWLWARADATARLGAAFDLKRFHSYALRLGPMGLDPFRDELARWDGA